jgi:predicted O-linked N-acetylglucosamine transferase (SPINDLY family)
MSEWHLSVMEDLEGKNYEKVINLYEEIIEHNPDEIDNYFYLGLAYLLADKEEDAQSTWFYLFSQAEGEKANIWNQQLVIILDKEAKKQKERQNYKTAELIRFHIKEIAPQNLNNLLHLINLGFLRNCFSFQSFEDWNVFQLLKNTNLKEFDVSILWDVLTDVLQYPSSDSINLLQISLKIMSESEDLLKEKIEQVINIGQSLGYDQYKSLYAADLLAECVVYAPDNINLLRDLSTLSKLSYQWEKSLNYHEKLDHLSQNLPQKLYNKYLLLSIYLTMSDWHNVTKICDEYKQLLLEMVEKKPTIEDKFLKESYLITTQPILYIQDNQKENRHLINSFGKLYQSHAQESYCYPVHFLPLQKLTPKRKLKIGYIGHTLRSHSVGFLSRWLINYHNREEFEIFIYFINQKEDEFSKIWFRDKADVCYNLPRNIIFAITQIQNDEIDILVDLDSLTHNLTNLIMSLKPAPIQVTWLGLDACGIPAIDYFIADPYVLPKDAQEYYQEKIWRLPDTYLGIDGFEIDVPNISRENLEIPADAIIYLNIQNALKRHPDTIHLQMRILKAVPNSYLLIKGNGDQETLKKQILSIAQEEGIEEDRLRFLDQTPTEAIHRANLAIADVVLDTYPYNGATTTLETLWMEIPLVTRVGEQFAARSSYTFMMNAGITEGIAWTDEEYIEWGIKLGTDENLRKEVSWKLRQSKKTSPLWNGKQFAREMEKAYQQMWEIYVSQQTKIE